MAKRDADNISGTDVLQAPQPAMDFSGIKMSNPPLTQVAARIFILENDKRQGSVFLDVEEDVIDPKTGAARRMRLLRGAHSIWFDEQSPSVYPKEYVNKNILMLQFDRGVCVIPVNEPNKIKAAELSNRNRATHKANGAFARHKDIYFYEWNPLELNKKAVEEENDVIKAMQLAMTVPYEEVVPHAAYLGIETTDEQGVPFDQNALRTAYIRRAKNDAKKFLTSIHSPTVKIRHMIYRAVHDTLIDLGKQPGAAYWTDGGFICTLPEGRDAIDYLTEYAMVHGENNAAFANQLRELST